MKRSRGVLRSLRLKGYKAPQLPHPAPVSNFLTCTDDKRLAQIWPRDMIIEIDPSVHGTDLYGYDRDQIYKRV